jgi:hypothetical protein
MKVYLDVSCLDRPWDDQSQAQVRLETEAIAVILDRCDRGPWQHLSSDMARIEIEQTPDQERRRRMTLLLPSVASIIPLSEPLLQRARELMPLGFQAHDAVHVAAAESLAVDVFLTCDVRLLRKANRWRGKLNVRVANPADWLKEVDADAHA